MLLFRGCISFWTQTSRWYHSLPTNFSITPPSVWKPSQKLGIPCSPNWSATPLLFLSPDVPAPKKPQRLLLPGLMKPCRGPQEQWFPPPLPRNARPAPAVTYHYGLRWPLQQSLRQRSHWRRWWSRRSCWKSVKRQPFLTCPRCGERMFFLGTVDKFHLL